MEILYTVQKQLGLPTAGVLLLWMLSQTCAAVSLPPDNAALIYYQACLKRSLLNVPDEFGIVLHGRDPSERSKQFVSHPDFREVIGLMNAATEISQCEWGLVASFQWRPERLVNTSLDSMANLLSVQGRVLAADGQILPAFEVALRMRRFAGHIGDDVYGMWVMSESVDGKAFSVIQYVLGKMAPDVGTLTWLNTEITRLGRAPKWQPRETLADWRDMEIRSWQASSDMFAEWKEALVLRQADDTAREGMRNLTDAQMLERARMAYDRLIGSIIITIESDISYLDKCDEIQRLVDGVRLRIGEGDPVAYMVRAVENSLEPYYRLHVHHMAHANAVKAALTLYLIKAKTGLLPQSLPDGLPGDPYSCKDFEYQITEEGFSLRCRILVPDYSEGPRQFDFKVAE